MPSNLSMPSRKRYALRSNLVWYTGLMLKHNALRVQLLQQYNDHKENRARLTTNLSSFAKDRDRLANFRKYARYAYKQALISHAIIQSFNCTHLTLPHLISLA